MVGSETFYVAAWFLQGRDSAWIALVYSNGTGPWTLSYKFAHRGWYEVPSPSRSIADLTKLRAVTESVVEHMCSAGYLRPGSVRHCVEISGGETTFFEKMRALPGWDAFMAKFN